jgi:hypothetical protein
VCCAAARPAQLHGLRSCRRAHRVSSALHKAAAPPAHVHPRCGPFAALLTLADARQVRERSGAPMHEVKAALVATAWDTGAPPPVTCGCGVAAHTPLPAQRRRWRSCAQRATAPPPKRCVARVAGARRHAELTLRDWQASRLAAEGLIGVANAGRAAVLVEINSETDFVARNHKFQARCVASRRLRTPLSRTSDRRRSYPPSPPPHSASTARSCRACTGAAAQAATHWRAVADARAATAARTSAARWSCRLTSCRRCTLRMAPPWRRR